MEKQKYHCEDCVGCKDDTCKLTNEPLNFDIATKTPCAAFIPAEYIKAINYDTR